MCATFGGGVQCLIRPAFFLRFARAGHGREPGGGAASLRSTNALHASARLAVDGLPQLLHLSFGVRSGRHAGPGFARAHARAGDQHRVRQDRGARKNGVRFTYPLAFLELTGRCAERRGSGSLTQTAFLELAGRCAAWKAQAKAASLPKARPRRFL